MVLLAQHPFCLAKWPWGLYTDASPSCKPTGSQAKVSSRYDFLSSTGFNSIPCLPGPVIPLCPLDKTPKRLTKPPLLCFELTNTSPTGPNKSNRPGSCLSLCVPSAFSSCMALQGMGELTMATDMCLGAGDRSSPSGGFNDIEKEGSY